MSRRQADPSARRAATAGLARAARRQAKATAELNRADEALEAAVAEARDAGLPWTEISHQLGISPSWACERYKKLDRTDRRLTQPPRRQSAEAQQAASNAAIVQVWTIAGGTIPAQWWAASTGGLAWFATGRHFLLAEKRSSGWTQVRKL